MNLRFISFILGIILLLEAVLMGLCMAFEHLWIGHTLPGMVQAWAVSAVLTATLGTVLTLTGKRAQQSQIFRREAIAVVGLGWSLAAIMAALPFLLAPLPIHPADCLFEAVSGLTTTGATIFPDLTLLPDSLLLWRSITQWLGGMGIVILFVALLGFLGVGSKILFSRETSAVADSDLLPRVQALSLRYLGIYLAFTAIAFTGLILCGLSPFHALNHAFTAISTGGFSTHNESIGYYSSQSVHLWIILVMITGGIAFPLHFLILAKRNAGLLLKNEECRSYLILLLFFATTTTLALLTIDRPDDGLSLPDFALAAAFQTTSIMTTTGFSTADYNLWPPLGQKLIILCMIFGGCAGSTSGGLKIARLLAFVKIILLQLRLTFRPNLVSHVRLNGKIIDSEVTQGVTFYIALYASLILAGAAVLAFLEPSFDLVSIFSASVSAVNNIGPALGEAGPASTYASYSLFGKLWLSFLMLVGRLEILAILLLFLPSFWRKF